ncbi:S8 family serine peptidase [Salinarchaeum sp. IM2453]|uniref:S8 family serine peptidase n=1 Tax=Salinarchaeum sp. IM2453 TaxID=2862870 RepID=UPI001C82E814|nr:S8 family serine peptidase [Salinarchaeum sp. IM2453]QZA89149.1 S8 family serine peptidase [Salinarchaeum sp. IM2453]
MYARRGLAFLLFFAVIAGFGLFVHSGIALGPDAQAISHAQNTSTTTTSETTYLVTFNTTDLLDNDTSPETLQAAADQSQESFQSYAANRSYLDVQNSFWLTSSAVVSANTTAVNQSYIASIDGVEDVYDHSKLTVSANSDSKTTSSAIGTQAADSTYGLDMIRAHETRETFDTTGDGVDVAVLDTGLDPDHDAIEIDEWAAFDENGTLTSDNPEDADDQDGHGTHVGGTIAGDPVDGTAIGVAPDAELHGVQVLDGDDASGTFAQIIAGIEWAIEDSEADIDVMQMSFGTDNSTAEVLIDPIQKAADNDIMVSASVGNEGENGSGSPGNVYESFSTGAVDEDSEITFFSGGEVINTAEQWNQSSDDWPDPDWPDEYTVPDVVAPGDDILSAEAGSDDGTGLVEKSGTSMSSPHVAGIAALLLTDDEVDVPTAEEAIAETAVHPEGPNQVDHRHGHGLVDSYSAMAYATSDIEVTGEVTLTDASGENISAEHALVQSNFGEYSTTTDTDGAYTLPITSEGETQTITVDLVGWEPVEKEITPDEHSDPIEIDFHLDTQTFETELQSPAPDYLASGEDYTVSHETLQVHNYTAQLEATDLAGNPVDTDDFAIQVNGQELSPSETYHSASVEEIINVSITPPSDFVGTLNVTHTFEGLDETTTIQTTGTTIHPDPLTVPTDDDPDQLQNLVDFVAPGTTIGLDADQTFSVTADDQQPVGVTLDKDITLRGEGGMATIAVEDTTATEQGIGAGISMDSSLENVVLSGDADTGIVLGGGTISNVDVTNMTVGVEVTDGPIDDPQIGGDSSADDNDVFDLTLTDVETGLAVTEDISTVANLTINTADTGVFVDGGTIEILTGLSITDSTTGVDVTDTIELEIADGTIEDTETAFDFGGNATGITVDDVSVGDTAIVFDGQKSATDVSLQHEDVTTTFDGTDTVVELNGSTSLPPAGNGLVGSAFNVSPQSSDGRLSMTTQYDEWATRGVASDTVALYEHAGGDWTAFDENAYTLNQSQLDVTIDTDTTAALYGDGAPYVNVTGVTIPDTIAPDDRLDASVTLSNEGAASAEDTVSYFANDTTVDTADISLAPHSDTEVALLHDPEDHASGVFPYQISTMNTTWNGSYTVDSDATGADISLTDSVLFNATISSEQSPEVSVTLENAGDLPGTYPISVTADDTEINNTVGYVEPDNVMTTTISSEPLDPGEYDIAVNGQQVGTLTVESDQSLLDEYPQLLLLVVGTLLVILGFALLEWRYTENI